MTTSGVGATLQRERLRQGLSLDAISSQTRISCRFLGAIEAENFDRLPGVLFTRNFVRQYAAILKLDPEPLLAGLPRVDIETAALPSPGRHGRLPGDGSRWWPAASALMWFALVAGVFAAAWFHFQPKPAIRAAKATRSASPAPLVATAPTSTAAQAVALPVQPPVEPPPVEQLSPAPGAAARPVQVVLKAKEASWVQIVADGKTQFTGILNPNDSRAVAADAVVKVTAGNAGGIEISLNGKPLDRLGPSGQVRSVRLTADGPQSVAKTPPPSPL